jgi:hypothetical protein
MRRLLLTALAMSTIGWLRRGLLKSLAMRSLITILPDPAKRRGIDMRFPIDRGVWTRFTLHADLSLALSGVLDHVVEAAAYSHYGGFKMNNVYSDFLNPDSPYYQAWIGAYVVLDNERRRHFGFDDQGRPVGQEALDILEADQRMVYWASGCPKKFSDGRLVRQLGEWTVSEVDSGGERWWRLVGQAETWSAYHRGRTPEGNWLHYWNYGELPVDAPHPVDDFHPLTYTGSILLRYRPDWQATCAKFYIYPEYTDRNGEKVTKGSLLDAECQALADRIAFVKKDGAG